MVLKELIKFWVTAVSCLSGAFVGASVVDSSSSTGFAVITKSEILGRPGTVGLTEKREVTGRGVVVVVSKGLSVEMSAALIVFTGAF
jgi:hypothetical protein